MIEPKITQWQILVGSLIATGVLILGCEIGQDVVGGFVKVLEKLFG